MKFKTKASLAIATLGVAISCNLLLPNLLTQLETNNQELACSLWEPSFLYTFNSDGAGGVKHWSPDNSNDGVTTMLPAPTATYDAASGTTYVELSNGLKGNLTHTPGSCVPDGTSGDQNRDYSFVITSFSNSSRLPTPRTSCCTISDR